MSKEKPQYESIKEFDTIANTLAKKYSDVLVNIDANLIRAVKIINKEPKPGKYYEIKPVPMPIRMDLNYDYYIIFNSEQWDRFDDAHKAILVFNVLYSLDQEEAKIIPPDLKDHSLIVRTVGVDYMLRSDIPNILKEDVDWKVFSKSNDEEDADNTDSSDQ
jgi:Putative phage metallopeptidase